MNKKTWERNTFGIIFCLGLIFFSLWTLENAIKWLNPPPKNLHDGHDYTYGHRLKANRFNFRERDFDIPKNPECFRIMVLGDSLTWGVGLATGERYTHLIEKYLGTKNTKGKVEVLNFGIRGGPLIYYWDIYKRLKAEVSPDLVIVGFCLNDPQPKGQGYSREKEKFEKDFRHVFLIFDYFSVFFPRLEASLRERFYRLLEIFKVVPPWWEALDRTYQVDSIEWKKFEKALRDIYSTAIKETGRRPIFLILNQGVQTNVPTDYRNPDKYLSIYLNWYNQADQAARAIGFRTINFEEELRNLGPKVLSVNPWDGHPSRELNRIYAQKTSAVIEKEYLRR